MNWLKRKFTWTIKIGPIALTMPLNPTGLYNIGLGMRALDTLTDRRR